MGELASGGSSIEVPRRKLWTAGGPSPWSFWRKKTIVPADAVTSSGSNFGPNVRRISIAPAGASSALSTANARVGAADTDGSVEMLLGELLAVWAGCPTQPIIRITSATNVVRETMESLPGTSRFQPRDAVSATGCGGPGDADASAGAVA